MFISWQLANTLKVFSWFPRLLWVVKFKKKKQAKNTIAAVQKIENKNFIKLFANVLFLRQRETDTVRTATGKNLTLNKQICASCRRATQR